MTSIQIAFHQSNSEYTHLLQDDLGQIGIPFDLIPHTDGHFAQRIAQSEDPVLLIVTDNFLKEKDCLEGLLDALKGLKDKNLLIPIVADGVDKDGNLVPTHIDRMVNALQYMNYWQNAWLELSPNAQQAEGQVKKDLESILDVKRLIANEIGDVISAFRDAGAVEWPQFTANNYALFFQKTNLQAWHETYITAQTTTPKATIEKEQEDTSSSSQEVQFSEMEHLLDAISLSPDESLPEEPIDFSHLSPLQDNLLSEPTPLPEADVKAMIRDAWFWIHQGHTDQGLELFNLAQEQYPENEELRDEAAKAHTHVELALKPAQETPTVIQVPQTQNEAENEAKSYDLMGDMAAEKGDYLFAKYCWDRAVELDSTFPDIYRKLGLMTIEHLRDYKETAAAYLYKALEINPNDAEVMIGLADWDWQNQQRDAAVQRYIQAIQLNPKLRTSELDALYMPAAKVELKQTDNSNKPVKQKPEKSALETPETSETQARNILTVLITGATSGIGRATAEYFAQYGHRLILTGRRAERLSELKTQLERKSKNEIMMLPFDIRDQATVQHVFEQLPESWKNIDILVNNAGLAKGLSPIHEGDLEHWETMIDTNIKGLLYVTRAIVPGMVQRKRGHIINVGSSAGKETYPNGNVYCATKFAVDALTRAMRMDLYTHNVRVSQVSPGHVEETEFAITRFDGDKEKAKIYDNFQPLKASDVAEVIYFMASRPAHVNIQDVWMFASQQASSLLLDRSGR
jgi:NADP-dependent 3-hydroxy acid dehydrogenase YdfG